VSKSTFHGLPVGPGTESSFRTQRGLWATL
jgi:hypothetical protein